MGKNINLSALTITELVELSKDISYELFTRYNDINIKTEDLYNKLKTVDGYNVTLNNGKITVNTNVSGKIHNVKVLYKNSWIIITIISEGQFINTDIFRLKQKTKELEGQDETN